MSLNKQGKYALKLGKEGVLKKDCLQGCGMVGASPEINKKKCNDTETATAWSSCQPLTGRKTRDDNCTERTAVARGAAGAGGGGQQTETVHLMTENSDPERPQPRRSQGRKDPFLTTPQACLCPLGGVQQKPRAQRSQVIQNTLGHSWAGDPREAACGSGCTGLVQMLPNGLSRAALLYHHVELVELAKS